MLRVNYFCRCRAVCHIVSCGLALYPESNIIDKHKTLHWRHISIIAFPIFGNSAVCPTACSARIQKICYVYTTCCQVDEKNHMASLWWLNQMETFFASPVIPFTKASDAELWCLHCSAWTNGWANNRDDDDLRCHRAHLRCHHCNADE